MVKGRSYSSMIGVLIKRGKLVTHTEGRGTEMREAEEECHWRLVLEREILNEQAYYYYFL